jgi:regulator of replication initiation timing
VYNIDNKNDKPKQRILQGSCRKMILLNDLEFLSGIAENKTGLYNIITEELGLDEKQQEKLVAELKYQFLYMNENVAKLKEYEAELEEENEYLDVENNELEADNQRLEEENYELREENEELRNRIND